MVEVKMTTSNRSVDETATTIFHDHDNHNNHIHLKFNTYNV